MVSIMSDTQNNAPEPPVGISAPKAAQVELNVEPTSELGGLYRLEMGDINSLFGHIKAWVEWRISKIGK